VCAIHSVPAGLALSAGKKVSGLDYSRLAQRYSQDRFVVIPGFLRPAGVTTLLAAMSDVASRRVQCGLPHVTWHQQNFDADHSARRLFEQGEMLILAKSLAGLEKVTGLQCWSSVYTAGEYINPHRDSGGVIQLLLCLQAPAAPVNGGELIVGQRKLFLTAGDAIAFEAARLEHSTTPLVATANEPNPRRIILVGRYFFENG
jgi:hypothetical protein